MNARDQADLTSCKHILDVRGHVGQTILNGYISHQGRVHAE